jgi:hypothetical protein
MLRVNVFVSHLSGERLWDVDKPLPQQIQIAVNINLLGLDQKSSEMIETPFVFAVNYTPSVAQINIKGKAQVSGDKNEIGRIVEDHKQQKPPPMPLIQAVSNASIAEAILISKTIGVPPPLPPLPTLPPAPQQPKTETRYTA